MRCAPISRLSFAAIFLAIGALGAGCDGVPTEPDDRASLAVLTNEQNRDVNDIAINDCTGEQIPITGHEHLVSSVTQEGVGTFHVGFHADLILKGTSLLTGASYIVNQTVDEHVTVAAGFEDTFVLPFILVGKGGVPNEVLLATFHITVRPDGTVTSLIDNLRIKC
jgi:hypothetical protein